MRYLLVVLLSLTLSSFSAPDRLEKIYQVLKYVESNNNPEAVGDNGKAHGVLQIHKICVDDINRVYNTDYTHQQAFDETHSREMFHLYIKFGIRLFKIKYCRSPTEEEIVRMWNGGIYRGYRIKATKKYYKRYIQFKRLLQK